MTDEEKYNKIMQRLTSDVMKTFDDELMDVELKFYLAVASAFSFSIITMYHDIVDQLESRGNLTKEFSIHAKNSLLEIMKKLIDEREREINEKNSH